MKKYLVMSLVVVAAGTVAACGADKLLGDGGTGADMAMPKLFKLQSGDYAVTALTLGNDGCMVDPNNAMNPTIGKKLPLVNDGMGNIGLGNLTGTPMQASNGSSCPGSPANAACATAPNAKPFNNNQGTLVRDNKVDDGAGCTFNRHIENLITLTADNTFTAAYTRTDTMHSAGCTLQKTDCTTTWNWTLVKQ